MEIFEIFEEHVLLHQTLISLPIFIIISFSKIAKAVSRRHDATRHVWNVTYAFGNQTRVLRNQQSASVIKNGTFRDSSPHRCDKLIFTWMHMGQLWGGLELRIVLIGCWRFQTEDAYLTVSRLPVDEILHIHVVWWELRDSTNYLLWALLGKGLNTLSLSPPPPPSRVSLDRQAGLVVVSVAQWIACWLLSVCLQKSSNVTVTVVLTLGSQNFQWTLPYF